MEERVNSARARLCIKEIKIRGVYFVVLEKKIGQILCVFCYVLPFSQMRLLNQTVLNFDQMYVYKKWSKLTL